MDEYNIFGTEDDDPNKQLAGLISPTSAAQLTGISKPPDGGAVRSIYTAPQDAQSAAQPAQQPAQAQAQTISPGAPTQAVNPDPNGSLRPGGSNPGAQPGAMNRFQQSMGGAPAQNVTGAKHNGFWRGLLNGAGKVADVAGSFLEPQLTSFIPGSSLYKERQDAMQQDRAKAVASIADTNSQTQQRAAEAAKATAQAGANTPRAVTAQEALASGNPALEGSEMRPSDIAKLSVQGLKGNTATQIGASHDKAKVDVAGLNNDAQADVRAAATKLKQAQTDAANADPNTLAGRQAIAKLREASAGHSAAMLRAQAGIINAQAGAFGTYNGQPLAGALLTDDGTPVGSHFSANVRPTGAQRGKANLATSAQDQINTMLEIAEKRPEKFGPGFGQAEDFKKWLGSQDPDAQRFRTAHAIAGEHAAAMFGSHSKEVIQQIDNALGSFHDNPEAAKAAMKQVLGATGTFAKAGTVRTVGSNNNIAPSSVPVKQGFIRVQIPGHPPGQIPVANRAKFLSDHKDAQVLNGR